MPTYNSVKLLSRSSLHWCATFGNRETRRLPNWSCFRSSMHCFHVLQRFVADEDFGSLTIQRPAFMIYTGLPFGLPLAVTSFNRYSRLVEALSRRFAFCLTSLYFDDAHVNDRKSCKGSGQELCSSCTGHHPQSWARERIEHKLLHLMKHAEDSSKLQPGAAAKIYGVANFFELGVWGRIGCGGKLRSGHMQGHVFWQPQMLH